MILIYHDVNHYDTNAGYIGVEFVVLNVYSMDESMHYVYLEVNIVIIVYMDL